MQFLSTILSVIVGGMIAIAGGFVQRICERRQERKSLRAALRAEIQAILDIVEQRDYIEGLSKFIEAIKGGATSGATNLFQRRVGKDYDTVFRSNCSKLGLLQSETAGKTVRFYYSVSSVVEDLVLLQDAGKLPDLRARYGLNTQDGNMFFHKQMLQLSVKTVALGNDLVRELS